MLGFSLLVNYNRAGTRNVGTMTSCPFLLHRLLGKDMAEHSRLIIMEVNTFGLKMVMMSFSRSFTRRRKQ